MTRVVDYGYIFEIILKKASKRLDEYDCIPPIEKQKHIGRILKKATIKALEKASCILYSLSATVLFIRSTKAVNR